MNGLFQKAKFTDCILKYGISREKMSDTLLIINCNFTQKKLRNLLRDE